LFRVIAALCVAAVRLLLRRLGNPYSAGWEEEVANHTKPM